jgi:hypothetical protein
MRTAGSVGRGARKRARATKRAGRRWRTASALGFAALLALAAWRITSAGDAAIERIDEFVVPKLAAGKGAPPYRLQSDWKLGGRSWGSDRDGDERERRFPIPNVTDHRANYDGLDVAEEGR